MQAQPMQASLSFRSFCNQQTIFLLVDADFATNGTETQWKSLAGRLAGRHSS